MSDSNFQEMLSRSAKDPRQVEQEERARKDRIAIEDAERKARIITADLQRMMVEKVQNGDYIKQNNKGQVFCFHVLQKCKYVKINTKRDPINSHTTWAQYVVNPEYSTEFNHLDKLLKAWGAENSVEITWKVNLGYDRAYIALGTSRQLPFPHLEYMDFKGNIYWNVQLCVSATSCFAINPAYPMDYMSEKDLQSKRNELYVKIESHEEDCRKQQGYAFMFGVLLAFIVCAIIWAYSVAGSDAWISIILLGLVGLGCLGLIRTYCKEAKMHQEIINECKRQLQK